MGDPVKAHVYIAVEIAVFAILISMVVYFSIVSRNMLSVNQYRENTAIEMRAYQEIASYNNKEVTGDELIVTTKKFTQTYNICVVQDLIPEMGGVPIYENILTLRTSDPLEKWSEKEVRKALSKPTNLVHERFKVFFFNGTEDQLTKMKYMYPSCMQGDIVFQKM